MSDTFSGIVDLLDENGAVVEENVQASFSKRTKRGFAQWGGQLGPHDHDRHDWMPVSRVRLPSGEVGTVILTNVHIGADKTARAQGSGPAPF